MFVSYFAYVLKSWHIMPVSYVSYGGTDVVPGHPNPLIHPSGHLDLQRSRLLLLKINSP